MTRRAYIADMAALENMSAEELERLHLPNKRTELIRGHLVVREPAGFRHGVVAARVARRLEEFVSANALGVVVGAETGFTLTRDPDTVRAPDAGFIRAARVPDPLPRGFAMLAPDLAVEVLSPDDRAGEVLTKVADWLTAGTTLVWVIDPERRLARIYRSDGSESLVTEGESFEGEDLLPGLRLPLAALL